MLDDTVVEQTPIKEEEKTMRVYKSTNLSPVFLSIAIVAICMFGISAASVQAGTYTVVNTNGNGADSLLAGCPTSLAPDPPTKSKPTGVAPVAPKVRTTKIDNDQIDLGQQALSKEDLDKVMKWIAVQVGAERMPFCWKQSKPRGAGVPANGCAEGQEKNGQLCYKTCDEGYTGNGPVCWANCPEGLTDIGGFCQKPAPYGRGFGYAVWDEQKCKNEHSEGCEQNAAMWYPKCKEGFHAVGSNICSPDCPEGFADTGTGCRKPSYGRGAGALQTCPDGYEKNGLLCYKKCEGAGEKGVGPVCWQQCPSHLPTECAMGCAKTTGACIGKIYEQTSSVVSAAISLASMGGENAVLKNLDKMMNIIDTVKDLAEKSDGNVPVMVGGQENLDAAKKITKLNGSNFKVATELGEKITEYANMFSDDFEALTTKEVADTINEKFSKEAADQIKKEWGIRHFAMTMQANGFKGAKDLLWLASFGDPTGLADVTNAFLAPTCSSDTPFPEVTPLID